MAVPRPAEAESSASAALRHALDGAASDLLRLQAQDFAPRGLVLVVGCVGVLLGLADEPPSWEDCQKMLRGHALRRKPGAIPLRRPTRAERNGQAGAVPASSFWQLLERFDVASVSAAQRQAVLAAIKDDFGGLLQPAHLGQVSRGAAALGRWLQVVQELLQTPPAPTAASCMGDVVAIASARSMSAATPAPMATLFTTTELERCPECGVRLERSAVGDHLTLCRARAVERRLAATAAAAEHAALAASAGYGICGGGGWRGGGCGGVGCGVGGGGGGGTVAAGSAASAAMGLITARERALITALAAERVHRLAVPPPMPAVEWVRPVSPRLTKPSSFDTPPAPITAPAPLAYAPTEELPLVVEPITAPAPPPAADPALPPEPGYEYLKARSGWAGTGWSAPFPPSARPLLDEAGVDPTRVDAHAQLLARLRPSSGRRSARRFVPISGEGGAGAGAGTGAGAGAVAGAGLAMLARHALAARHPSAARSAAAARPEIPQRPPSGATPSSSSSAAAAAAAPAAVPAGFARAVSTTSSRPSRAESVSK